MTVTPIPVIIDSDGGCDDAAALWFALTDPRLDVVALVATWGDLSLDGSAVTLGRVLAAAGRPDIPVALGAAGPIAGGPLLGRAPHVHGEDGLGGTGHRWPLGPGPVGEPAVELLARVTAERPGEVAVCTIGPLTTLAAALRGDPGVAGRIRELVVMGGSAGYGGNATPATEANIGHDPTAAQEVVAAAWRADGPRPLLVGLDATMAALLTADDLALAAEARTPAGAMLGGALPYYAAFYAASGATPAGSFPCHDLLATVCLADPEVAYDAPVLPLAVDCGGGAAWGTTVVDRRSSGLGLGGDGPAGFHPWRIALGVDTPGFRATFRTLCGG